MPFDFRMLARGAAISSNTERAVRAGYRRMLSIERATLRGICEHARA
jgi:hypothetical protein